LKELGNIKDFGNIDAKLDNLLEDCFEEHKAFGEIKSFEKFLIIGKKGSGKTAIFQKLIKEQAFDYFCEGYNLTDYPWYHHELQAKAGVPDSEKFIHSWKYLLLISLSKILINADNCIPFDDNSRESLDVLEKFIKDTYGTTNPNIANIFTPTKKIKFNSLIGGKLVGQEFQLQLPFEEVDMKDLPIVIQDVNRNLTNHIMRCLHPEHCYFICFDELDISLDINSNNYFNSIIGLIRAARDFNLEAKKNNKKANICVFLRDDIYDILKFEDKRKITQNFVTRIEWDTNRTNNTLRELMEKRFNKLLSENEDELIEWNDVFDETVSINGRNSKYNYLKDMTCLRPRDIIDLCNNILISYKNNGCVSRKFTNLDIVNAKENYSRNLLDEFDDEVHKHIPEYETYLDMIKKVGTSKFSFDSFNAAYEKLKSKLEDEKDAMTILEELYTFSIVGNYKIGGTHGGSEKVFRYKDTKEKLRDDLQIIVHPGIVNVLGLKEK
jgi:hypothetical protein